MKRMISEAVGSRAVENVGRMLKASLLVLAMSTMWARECAASDDVFDRLISVNIPADTTLEDALITWGTAAGVSVMINTPTIEQRPTHGVRGTLRAGDALAALLRSTGMSYTREGDRVRIVPRVPIVGSALRDTPNPVGVSSDDQTAGRDKDLEPDVIDHSSRSRGLSEVIVTADRREERISDVPMSIQAFKQQDLDQQGLHNIDDLTRVSPGVTFLRSNVGGSSNYNDENSDISIRGVDSNSGAATVAIYLDDTPIQGRISFNQPFPFPDLFDLERVEVLKGPQGTLFGAGAEGGAIRFITPDPSLTKYTGYTIGEASQLDHGGQNYRAGAAFGGPLIEGVLGFRISASFREDGGWVNRVNYSHPPSVVNDFATVYTSSPAVLNVTEPNANWQETTTFRAALKWQALDNLTIQPSIYYQRLHINDTGAYWMNISQPAMGLYYNGNLLRDYSTDPWYLGAVKINWSLPWALLTSNTSYLSRNQRSISDYSQYISALIFEDQYPTSAHISTAPSMDTQRNFTQEIRLSSTNDQAMLQWTAGLFYMHAYQTVRGAIVDQDLAPNAPGNLAYDAIGPQVDDQLAGFGEATVKLPAKFSFTAGVRYAKLDYRNSGTNTVYGAFAGSPDGVLVTHTSVRSRTYPITPRFILKYKPTSDDLYYLSASKGFRAGNANQPFPDAVVRLCGTQIPTNVSPDVVWQYELGAKKELLDQRLQLSVSAYYLRWQQIQQSITLQCGYGLAANLGNAIGKGGELAFTWHVTSDLSLGATGAYTDTVYEDIVPFENLVGTSTLVRNGDHLPASPWNLDINGQYAWNQFRVSPYFRVDYQFATAQRSLTAARNPENLPNADPTVAGLPELRVLSIRGGARFDGLDVSVFIQNLLNYHEPLLIARDVVTSPGATPNYDTLYFGRGYPPRTIGITLKYDF